MELNLFDHQKNKINIGKKNKYTYIYIYLRYPCKISNTRNMKKYIA